MVTNPSLNNSSDKIKHLEFIQATISRMSAHSFQCKGLYISLVTALLGLVELDKLKNYFVVFFLMTIVFWFLDAFFLRQERLYRKLYELIISSQSNTTYQCLCMNTSCVKNHVSNEFCIMIKAKTLLIMYSCFLLVILYMCFHTSIWNWLKACI